MTQEGLSHAGDLCGADGLCSRPPSLNCGPCPRYGPHFAIVKHGNYVGYPSAWKWEWFTITWLG